MPSEESGRTPGDRPPRQLAFAWPHNPDLSRARFIVGTANAEALGAVEAWRNWPGGIFLLTGEAGSGKTHLAGIWAGETDAQLLPPERIEEALECIAPGSAAAVELPGAPGVGERPLLHLLNHVRQIDARLLLTARDAPGAWTVTLPDLQSRLAALPTARLEAPDEALLVAVMAKHLGDRGVRANPAALAFAAPRMERSFEAAADLAARLDRLSAERGEPISRSLVKRALEGGNPGL
jgi:chromosomal replication initiation ATPase DnaA